MACWRNDRFYGCVCAKASVSPVIPSGAAQRRRRGIAVVPTEALALYQDECDSSPPGLRPSARNDSRRFPATRYPSPVRYGTGLSVHSWPSRAITAANISIPSQRF